ncbi:zinc finger protein 615-like [Nymphalis io]|uniref:zinc finger protein 615-like n=1 Tax=Inachis io TaxID=171585 RepID=UPI002166F4F1|nr:zinc finger protein 615-like [Nymphalis io]
MDNTCRLCLKESPEIVEELWEGCEVLDQLSSCLSHYVPLTKELPNKICYPCVNKVQEIHIFHQKIYQNELILQKKLNDILCDSSKNISDIKQENELYYDENDFNNVNKETNKEKASVFEINVKSELLENKLINEDSYAISNVSHSENSLNIAIDNVKIKKSNGKCINEQESNCGSVDDIQLKVLKENKNTITELTKINDTKRYMCLTCFKVFHNQRELLRHYQTIELEKYNEKNIEIKEKIEPVKYQSFVSEDGTLMYKCERCYKKYIHKVFIERHIKSHIEKRPFLCKLCGKTYQTASIIVAHGKMHMGEMYACSYNCGYRSVHKHVVKDHEKRHRKEYKYKCEVCGKGFQVKTSYEQHQNIHKGIKPFSCDICSMTFHLHKYLTTHRSNVHPQSSGRKPWVCKQCLLPCDSKNSLNIHLKDKHGIIVKVSILCDICGKVVRDTQQLKSHQRSVHLNIKPYTCSVCNKSFPKKFTLKVHEQTHTGKLYVCSVCDKKFSRQSSLQRHLQRFHVDSKLKCQKCEKVFTTKVKLTPHKKNCSGNIDDTRTS